MLSKAELSPQSLSHVLEQSSDCVKLIAPDGRLLWMNPNGLCAMEIDNFQTIEGQEWANLWPEENRSIIRQALASAQSGKVARLEAFCPTAKGRPRWWEVSVAGVKDASGAHAGFISTSRDITQAYVDREALHTLLAEMRHRLKNSFAMVCAMLKSMARGHAEHSAFAEEMVTRIAALATAQTLFDGEQAASDLGDLLRTLISPFRENGRHVVALTCPDRCDVTRQQADVIALVVGELTVNSTKHGAIGNGGAITLGAEVSPVASGTSLSIVWRETSNVPVVATSRSGGQGLALIERLCAARGGTFALEWLERGLVARLDLPIG